MMHTPGVKLAEKRNMIFAGTMVTAGAALALVTATGMSSEIGKIQATFGGIEYISFGVARSGE
jgi:magnesium-transporting ATPase (P-type)